MKSANFAQKHTIIFLKQVQIVCDVCDIYNATFVVYYSL